ncbi:hypothetical protein K3495_g6652 [Podosphaera aphanis]|nr:hypothetical protein K3495_g6652 [Podosphaera aphanis]
MTDCKRGHEDQALSGPTKLLTQPQLAELVDNLENNHQIDLPKRSALDKQVTAELRIRERHRRQAAYDSQSQDLQSQESENVRLRDASTKCDCNSRIGRQHHDLFNNTPYVLRD